MANSAMAAYDSNDEDTDSLEIKPPQMISRYDKHKKSSRDSSSRDKKHSRSEHRHKDRTRDRTDRHVRQHHTNPSSGRHHSNLDSSYDKYHLSHQKRRKRYSPEKTDGERELEDLRSRLLSKRSKQDIERKIEEHQLYQRNGEEDNARSRSRDEQHQHKSHSRKSVIELIDSPEDYADLDPSEKYKSVKHKSDKPAAPPEDPETIKRRAKFLDADREMTKRKEKAREELEARRELRREKGNISESPHSHKRSSHHKSHRQHRSPGEHSIIQLSETEDDDKSSQSEKDGDDDDDDDDDDEEDDTESESGTNTKSNYSRSEDQSDADVPTSPLSVGDLSKSEHRRRRSRSHSKSRSKSRSTSHSRSRSRSRSHSRSTRSRSRSTSHDSRSDRRRDSSQDSDHNDDKHSPHSKKRGRRDSNASESQDVEMKSEAAPESKPNETKEIVPEKAEEEELPDYYPGLQGCRSVEEFKCLNRIAEGTYGIVFRAQDKRTQEIVALKRLKMEKEKDGFPITSLREINTLLKGQHPNIVTVREIVVGSNMDKIFIVMDYVEHDFKTLMETMQHRKQSFLPAEVKCLTQQLLAAVAHLHDNWILHRDLKTSNLLLSHKGVLKVGDFGLAREYGSPLKPYTPVVVTLWYRAPELLLCCKEYSTPIDMWSVGCIFAEFLSMSALFPGQSETDQLNKIFKFLGTPNEKVWPGYNQLPAVQKIKFAEYPVSNVRERFGRRTSDLGIQLLQGLLTYDPKQRLTAEQALRNSYFKELPLPIDPAMLPTWPAKSELCARKALAASPKPPSGGGQFKKLTLDVDENRGFILGAALDAKARHMAMGPGFNLKF